MKTLVYIHGFNSSPQSEKARLTEAYFQREVPDIHLEVAHFPPQPLKAIHALRDLVRSIGEQELAGFIGSSLGGYYSLYLHVFFQRPAVLINPALRPYDLLQNYLGLNENLHTGERYLVTQAHMDELKQLDVLDKVEPSSLYLLTQTGDEVLDFHQAATALNQAKCWITAGGDHAFQGYQDCLPSIVRFFKNQSSL